MLLQEEYKQLDESWIFDKPDAYAQLQLHTAYLESMLLKHGELHCEYCGKQHLQIIPWQTKKTSELLNIMATVDHYDAVQNNPELKKEESNFRVACHPCNNNKQGKKWVCKHPYQEHINHTNTMNKIFNNEKL